MTLRKVAFLGALLGVLAYAGTATASDPIVLPTGQEGCVSPAGDTCTYTPTRDGGYAARGDAWTLTVVIPAPAGDPRDTNLDGNLRYVFDPSNAPEQGCGLYPVGATVTTAAGADSGIAAGNPFPGATDPVVGSANDCEAGKVAADNPNYTPAD